MNTNFIRAIEINRENLPEDSYVRQIPSLKNLDGIEFDTPVTFFVGENGSGKSTLLEAIAVAYGFNAEGGTKNYNFSTYDSHSDLYQAIKVIRGVYRPTHGYFLRAESFYNVATKEEEYSRTTPQHAQHYHEKSHGESFLQAFHHNFVEQGIYLIDEPEAALSIQRQITFLIDLYNGVKERSQFIIVTHSPILLSLPDAKILSFDNGEIHEVSYEETESYKVTELFINNRESMLNKLLHNEEKQGK